MAEMRASQLKEDLVALGSLGHEAAARILAELPPAHLKVIERSTRVDWLPVEVDVALVQVIHAEVGDEGLRHWGREALRRSFESSALRPLITTVARVFGLSPAALLKAAPQAWRATFRGCGELSVEEASGGLVVRLVGLPSQLHHRPFQLSIGGSLEAVFDLAKVDGHIRLVEPGGLAEARYEVSWTEA